MPSTYSPKLKFELIAPGEQPGLWGDTTNKNIGELIEQAIAGVTTLNLTSISGNVTLSSLDGTLDQARSAVISCEGTAAGAINIIVPTSTKLYVFRNACGQTITIKTAAQVGGYPLVSGESNFVFCNGVSVLPGLVTAGAGTLPVSGGGTGVGGAGFPAAGFLISPGGTTAFTTQAKINLLTDVVNALPVVNGGTGRSSLTANNVLLGDGTSAVQQVAPGANGNVLTSNGTTWQSTAPTPAGVVSFNGRPGVVTSQVGDYSSFYYPLSGNPSNFVTSASLTNFAALNANNTFTSSISTYTTGSNITMQGSTVGDQRLQVSGAGGTSGLAPASIQIGAPQVGLVYDLSNGGLSMGRLVGTNITCFSAFLYANTDNTQRPTGGPWISPSDERLKENIVDYTKGLSAIQTLRPVNYVLKGKLGEDTKHKVCTGLIAQEVLDTPLSTMVGTNPDGFYSLDANEVTWALVNAVKELKAELDTAKAEIAALKAK